MTGLFCCSGYLPSSLDCENCLPPHTFLFSVCLEFLDSLSSNLHRQLSYLDSPYSSRLRSLSEFLDNLSGYPDYLSFPLDCTHSVSRCHLESPRVSIQSNCLDSPHSFLYCRLSILLPGLFTLQSGSAGLAVQSTRLPFYTVELPI